MIVRVEIILASEDSGLCRSELGKNC